MLAFHNNPKVKEKYLARVRAHRAADQIIHGRYWENGKGCAVGCTIHSGNHDRYESELGIPAVIAYLEDAIFEGMSNGESMTWPERFLEAIPVGADLSLVWSRFALWLLADPTDGVIRFVDDEQGKAANQQVAALHQRIIDGGEVKSEEWAAARAAARDAAWDAARDAARDAAWDAAWAAARAAARDAARAAAWDAARAAARAAAWDVNLNLAYVRQSEKLLELLATAPVPEMVMA